MSVRAAAEFFEVEGFPSGQREQTVNLSAMPSEVRILPPPPSLGPDPIAEAASRGSAAGFAGGVILDRLHLQGIERE